MGRLKNKRKYTPPPIEVFKKYGYGLVFEASLERSAFVDAFTASRKKFYDREKFLHWAEEPKYPRSDDLVDVYGYWAWLDDLLSQLRNMDPSEREKHLALNAEFAPAATDPAELEKTEQLFIEISGELAAWEAESSKEFYPVLNALLKRRLDAWEKHLDDALQNGFEPSWEFWGDANDYRRERSVLEYAKLGILMLRAFEPLATGNFNRLQPLPYYEEYCKRLDALDVKFRELLKNAPPQVEPWADPTFWWYTPIDRGAEPKK